MWMAGKVGARGVRWEAWQTSRMCQMERWGGEGTARASRYI